MTSGKESLADGRGRTRGRSRSTGRNIILSVSLVLMNIGGVSKIRGCSEFCGMFAKRSVCS